MSPLLVFINRQLAVPFVWGGFDGGTDCTLMLGDWWLFLHGVDPVDHLRMTYDSRASCYKETGWFRDPVSVIARVAEGHCGLSRTSNPAKGDIGIAMLGRTPVGAICLGRSWAMKAEDMGIITVENPNINIIAAWGVGYVDP